MKKIWIIRWKDEYTGEEGIIGYWNVEIDYDFATEYIKKFYFDDLDNFYYVVETLDLVTISKF